MNEDNGEMEDKPGEEVGLVVETHHLHALSALRLLFFAELGDHVEKGKQEGEHEVEREDKRELAADLFREVDKGF